MIPTIAPLRNVGVLMALMEQVQARAFSLPGMACYYGPSGWGKTTATTYAANAFDAHVVQVKDCWTPSFLGEAILREIGLQPVKGVARMVEAAGRQLALTDRPLIVDDAQYLMRKRMIHMIRDIYESSQAPIILVGEEQLPQSLTAVENVHNRMLDWVAALPCNIDDAQHLTEIYAPRVAIADDLLRAIVDASGGSIRRVAVNLSRAQELASARGSRSADRGLWGDRDFMTGEPPAVRKVADFRATRGSAAPGKARRA